MREKQGGWISGFKLQQLCDLRGIVNLTGRGENCGTNGIFFNLNRSLGVSELMIAQFGGRVAGKLKPFFSYCIWSF